MDTENILAQAREQLAREGADVAALENRAAELRDAAPAERDALLKNFHAAAEPLPYAMDSDFGALLLESEAAQCADRAWKATLFGEALHRAQSCAAAATAGGEGLARMQDVRRIEAKLAALSPHGPR